MTNDQLSAKGSPTKGAVQPSEFVFVCKHFSERSPRHINNVSSAICINCSAVKPCKGRRCCYRSLASDTIERTSSRRRREGDWPQR